MDQAPHCLGAQVHFSTLVMPPKAISNAWNARLVAVLCAKALSTQANGERSWFTWGEYVPPIGVFQGLLDYGPLKAACHA